MTRSKIDGSKYHYWRERFISTGSLKAFDLMTRHYIAGNFVEYAPPVGKRRRPEGFDHVPLTCSCGEYNCIFCSGGLFACERCGSFESATTTDCPGKTMTTDQSDAVYLGDLDFRANEGWVNRSSRYSPSYFKNVAELKG